MRCQRSKFSLVFILFFLIKSSYCLLLSPDNNPGREESIICDVCNGEIRETSLIYLDSNAIDFDLMVNVLGFD